MQSAPRHQQCDSLLPSCDWLRSCGLMSHHPHPPYPLPSSIALCTLHPLAHPPKEPSKAHAQVRASVAGYPGVMCTGLGSHSCAGVCYQHRRWFHHHVSHAQHVPTAYGPCRVQLPVCRCRSRPSGLLCCWPPGRFVIQ